MKIKLKKFWLTAMVLAMAISVVSATFADNANAATVVKDPSFNIIAGQEKDSATINEDGTINLAITPTVGFGFRANAANLGELNLLDVKKFSTTFTLKDVPAKVTTIFSLQTISTGTIGPGNGLGLQIMFRKEASGKIVVSFYDQSAGTALWTISGSGVDAREDGKITIEFDYDKAHLITVTLAQSYTLPGSVQTKLKPVYEEYYADNDYKAYYSISSYYWEALEHTDIIYTIDSINGKTPLALYKGIVEEAIEEFESAAGALTEDSPASDVIAAEALNIFDEGDYKTLLDIVDGDGALQARIDAAQENVDAYSGAIIFEQLKTELEEFSDLLEACDIEDEDEINAVIVAFMALDRDKYDELDSIYKNQLEGILTEIAQSDKFKQVLTAMVDLHLLESETNLSDGKDVVSLELYNKYTALVDGWEDYKPANFITDDIFTASEIAAFDARILAIEDKLAQSFYNNFWTEGNTWNVIKQDIGLYATGEGKYYETLGYNQKLELNKNANITFNIIYALRVLGSNHLHIGFYPKTEAGTKGDTDGVRVDFWFSAANTVEIKPVNGRTENALYDSAFLSIPDAGLIDIEADELDYEEGRYKIELVEEDGYLMVVVNGNEMDVAMDPEVFKDGVYITISAMSVAGADANELLITNIGGKSFVAGIPDDDNNEDTDPSPSPTGPTGDENDDDKRGCKGSIATVGAMFIVVCASVIVIAKRKSMKC